MKRISLKFTTVLGFFLVSHSSQAQSIQYWQDSSSKNFVNHRITKIIEDKNHYYLLGISHDEEWQNKRMSFSRLDHAGKVLNFTIYELLDNIHDVRGMAKKPDGLIRIYGTAINNGIYIPYVNDVTAGGKMPNNTMMMVSVPHYMGDMQAVNDSFAIYTKAVRGSATNLYNTFTYKINLANNDEVIWRYKGESTFNEESSALFQMKDGTTLVLAKRYTDESFMNYYSLVYKLSANGELVWLAELEDFQDFTEHSIAADEGGIYVVQQYGYDRTGKNQTIILKLDLSGGLVNNLTFDNINANGMLSISGGNKILYGGVFKPDGMSFIEKGKAVYLDASLKILKEREMGPLDAPDAKLPGLAMTVKPTSSDFLTGKILKNGKIALAGRVFMPVDTHPDRIMLSNRTNQNLLLITNEKGEW